LGLAELPPQLIAAGRTDPGQRRGLNEDAWRIADESELGGLIEERGQLFAVADGMGGHAAGEVASQMAIETLFAEYYGGDDAPMSPAMRLEQAILTANAQIYEQAGAKASQAGMGTTIVAAVARGEWLTIANVGDSRAYLIRDGAVQQLTHDHSWVAEQVTAGLLTEQQAQNHMYRNVVTRCLGHNPQIEVDTFEHVLEPGDAILLCSDGLSNQVSEDELSRVISEETPYEAVTELVELANRYGGPDNITAVLLKLQSDVYNEVTLVAQASPGQARREEPASQPTSPELAAPVEAVAPAQVLQESPTKSVSPLIKWGVPLGLVLLALSLGGISIAVWGPGVLQEWFMPSTATPLPVVAPTYTETAVPAPTATATVAPSPTWTPTAVPTATAIATRTPTRTPTRTATPTSTPTRTSTPLPSMTPEITGP
jgi:serine/threonine protein phosphatase PrpC